MLNDREYAEDDPLTSAMMDAAQGHPLLDVIAASMSVLCQSVYLKSGKDVHVAVEKIEQICELAKKEIMLNEGNCSQLDRKLS